MPPMPRARPIQALRTPRPNERSLPAGFRPFVEVDRVTLERPPLAGLRAGAVRFV